VSARATRAKARAYYRFAETAVNGPAAGARPRSQFNHTPAPRRREGAPPLVGLVRLA